MDCETPSDETSAFTDVLKSNSYTYEDTEQENILENDRIIILADPKDEFTSLGQTESGTHILSSSTTTINLTHNMKDNDPPESQPPTPLDESENYKCLMPEGFNLENIDLSKDEFSNVAQDTKKNETKKEDEPDKENDCCCSCSNDTLLCLAVLCDCFGL